MAQPETGSAVDSTPVIFQVNGRPVAAVVSPLLSLRNLLHDELHLHATKAGCGHGGCGACTVQIDGELALSCLVPAALVQGRSVTTLEGIAPAGELHPLQVAFDEHFAAQCGYCTPGMIMAAKALLDRNPSPTRGEIETALAGNLCRCTGYIPIIEAIEAAAVMMREGAREQAVRS